MNNMRSSLIAASMDSVQSALHLSDFKNDENATKFLITISFLDFKDITTFCKFYSDEEAAALPSKRTFWLSWVLFDKTFQSEEFTEDDADPQRVRDTIRVCCSKEALIRSSASDSSLRVFLCTQGSILAAIGIPLQQQTLKSDFNFPFTSTRWNDLEVSSSLSSGFLFKAMKSSKPAVKVSIAVTIDSEVGVGGSVATTTTTATATGGSLSASRIPRRLGSNSPPDKNTIDNTIITSRTSQALISVDVETEKSANEFEYSDESFEADEGSSSNVPMIVKDIQSKESIPSREVRFSAEVKEGFSDRKSGARKVTRSRDKKKTQEDLCETSSEDAGDSLDEAEEGPFDDLEADDVDDYTRHFRVNIEVRSIGGLKRAANAAIQFSYPFLGSGGPVRTHPLWLPANTESKVDGAVASYHCCMSRNRLRDILSDHPLKISASSRTHLGNSNIGGVTVDLFGVFESKPHSYRCPMTNKTFKTRAEYVSHRQSLLSLRSLGQVDRVPPKDSAVVWAYDSYLPLAMDGVAGKDKGTDEGVTLGGLLRVVVIIEEISIVGAELAMPIKPGYKMHNGALYMIKDQQPQYGLSSEGESGDEGRSSLELPPQPLDRVGLTVEERVALERLKGDWETFRKATEVQWRDNLKDREMQMRNRLEAEASSSLAEKTDDLRRAQEETGRLEVRLRGAIDEAERQKSQLRLKEEQMQMKLAQKTAELQLLQRRVRDEAKARIDSEVHRSEGLLSQVSSQKQQIERLEKRAKDTEREFESFRSFSKGTPEAILREDVARLRAQLGGSRAEVERERRVRSEAELEKEHFRAQMHRLALALKRERERSTASARQDLEQLRLEFLAREERYVLDGDREELRTIRCELANLRSASHGQIGSSEQQQNYYPQQNQQQQSFAQTYPVQQQQQYLQQRGAHTYPQSQGVGHQSSSLHQSLPTVQEKEININNYTERSGSSYNRSDSQPVFDTGYERQSSSSSLPSKLLSRPKFDIPTTSSNYSDENREAKEESYIQDYDEESPRVSMQMMATVDIRTVHPMKPQVTSVLSQVSRPINTAEQKLSHSDNLMMDDNDPRANVRYLRRQIDDLLETGMYSSISDPVIAALNTELARVEAIAAASVLAYPN